MGKRMNDDKIKERLKAAKKPAGSVFDVRRPGKAIASPTSRPVITGHKPEAQAAQTVVSGVGETSPMLTRRKIQIMPGGDIAATKEEVPPAPQVTDAEGTPVPEEEQEALGSATLDAVVGPPELPTEEEKPVLAAKSERKIEPLTKDEPKEEASEEPSGSQEESVPTDESAKTEPEAAKDEQAASDSADAEKATAAELETPSEETPSVDTSAATEGEQPKPEGEAEPPKPEPDIKPLFDSSGVIVSKHHHRHSRHGLKVFFLVLLILVLAAAALNIALDLELLKVEGLPHTDLL